MFTCKVESLGLVNVGWFFWFLVVNGVYEQCILLMVGYAVNVHYGITTMVQVSLIILFDL